MDSRFAAQLVVVLAALTILTDWVENSQAQDPAVSIDSAVKPKELTEHTKKGLAYLVDQQDASGGWGQGGGWRQNIQGNGPAQGHGRVEGSNVLDPPDLGNTCIATLALIRSGNTPQQGPSSKNVAQAVSFICYQVEKSNGDSLYVTDVRDTQLQSKIGQYVDTFLAGLVLSELKGKMPADGSDKRLQIALDKTVAKIEKNQKADGTFAGNTGWASILSQGLATKFMNRAAQNRVALNENVLQRDYQHSVVELNKKTGKAASPSLASKPMPLAGRSLASRTSRSKASGYMGGAAGDAGVNLYSIAGNASRINDFGNTNLALEARAKEILASKSATLVQKESAKADLVRIADVKSVQQAAVSGLILQLDDKHFVAGFGNNGGEEFLSYMNISEMLVAKGGPEWERWDKSITENLDRVQNNDGSWSGQHCITGRTFCTAAALLTKMADRAPVPLAARMKDREQKIDEGDKTSN